MKTFECPPGMEVSGNVALSMLTNLQAASFVPFLERYDLLQIEPERWYPFQDVLNVYRDVSEQQGGMFDLVAAGLAAADRYPMSPEVASLGVDQFFLEALPNLPNTQYRNGIPTRFDITRIGPKHLKLLFTSAYPDDTIYGFVYGHARRCLARRAFVLRYDDTMPRRDQGGDDTTLDLSWA